MPDPLMLELRWTLPAGRAAVWAALADPERLRRWWGPAGFSVGELSFDPRPGAPYRIEMRPPQGAPFGLAGSFIEVEPPARLAFTFVWDPPDPEDVETVVGLMLFDRGDATELTCTQGPFATAARRELHRDGWAQALERLAAELHGA